MEKCLSQNAFLKKKMSKFFSIGEKIRKTIKTMVFTLKKRGLMNYNEGNSGNFEKPKNRIF